MKLIESHNQIRITNDKGTKLIIAIRNEETNTYRVSYTAKGVYKTLTPNATIADINAYAVKLLTK